MGTLKKTGKLSKSDIGNMKAMNKLGATSIQGSVNKKTGKHTVTKVNNVSVAGGGGMHQMGAAKKTKKKLNAKQRTLSHLRKNKGKII